MQILYNILTSIVVGKVFNAASLFTVVFLVSKTTCYVFIYISKVTPESIFDTSLLPHIQVPHAHILAGRLPNTHWPEQHRLRQVKSNITKTGVLSLHKDAALLSCAQHQHLKRT